MLLPALVPSLLSALLGGPVLQERGQGSDPALALQRLWALTTDDDVSGAVVTVSGGPPWSASLLAPTEGGRSLRRFGRTLFVVNTGGGTIRRVPLGGGALQDYDLGPTSEPQDIHVGGLATQITPLAWVTRRHDPFLLELNLATGQGTDVLDLSPVGGGAEIALGSMASDGGRLLLQVRVEPGGSSAVPNEATGVLAVVDLATRKLIDVEPLTPGVQGIALSGAPPRFDMQILGRTLFVSTTDSHLDARGGIEMVNLDTLTSAGFAITEEVGGSDMGGFVMTKPDEGYYVFHTDLLASTHLKHFTIQGGPDPGFEILVLLNDTVDQIAHDPLFGRIFLPSGFAWGTPGLYVISTQTNEVLGPPVDTILRPHDVIVR